MQPNSDLIELCRQDGVALKGSGTNLYGKCPFHHDTKASFRVRLTARGYWVFNCWSTKCGVRGGARKYRELTNRPPPVRAEKPGRPPKEQYEPTSPDLMARAARHYAEQLPQHPEAVQYLAQRGIDPSTASKWGLGYAPGDSLYRLISPEMTGEQIERCALLRHWRRDDRFTRRIVIPQHLSDGSKGWITARAIDSDREPKYLHLPGRRPALMTIVPAHGNRRYPIIVEGPFDALAVCLAGYPAQCTNGQPYEDRLAQAIKEQRLPIVYIIPDQDDGGAGWAAAVGRAAVAADAKPILVILPPGVKDPAELATQPLTPPARLVATAIRIAQVRYPNGWTPPPKENANDTDAQKEDTEMAHLDGDPIEFFGHLTRDPESRDTRNNSEMLSFGVAVNHNVYDGQQSKYVETTIFYDCVAFSPLLVKQIKENLRRGDYGWFAGNMVYQEYERRDGSPGYAHRVTLRDAHVNLQLVKRDYDDDRGRDRDRDRDRDRGRDDRDRDRDDRRPEHDRPRPSSRDRDRDDDRDRGRDRGRDRDDDRGRDRSDDRDDRRNNRSRDDRDDRNGDRSRDREDNRSRDDDREPVASRHGDWSPPPDNDEDLPF